jgi:hypothetical protein
MSKYKMMKQGLLIFMMCGLIACSSTEKEPEKDSRLITVNYTVDSDIFPNPERGFYRYTESRSGSSATPLDVNTLKSYRNESVSLIYRVYYLKDFKDKALSQAALEQTGADMAILRAAGLKCVLRFAYSSNENEADAPLNMVLQHLEQLQPVLETNADVIAVLQAGFIGAWGEWYYSSNNLKTPGIRATILNKILDVLPDRRMIQVRTPAYKTDYVQRNTPVAYNEAFSGTKAARIGHHNDCFMASNTDYGTYTSKIEEEKNYIGSEGVYLPVGGETCPPDGVDPADCVKAEGEMRHLHWSFLNQDYYHGVNDRWKTLGCMNNIIRELGYRFTLQTGAYSDEVAPGGEIKIELAINNTGYSSPYNPRKMEFVLKNTETGEIYIAAVNEDPRFWKPMIPVELKFGIGLPHDIPAGMYDLYLNLPDPEPLLYSRPEYAIRLANKDVWDAATGYNYLQHQVKIAGNASAVYQGNEQM